MAVNVKSIDTPDWSISLAGVGEIVRDGADISQCIKIIVTTEKGSDPLRPNFGADIHNLIDLPINVAIPAIKRNIIEQVNRWEPRARIERVNHKLDGEKITFFVVWRDTRTGNENETELEI